MSAWVVSRNHISFMVEASTRHRWDDFEWFHGGRRLTLKIGDDERASEVAQMLWDENIRSVSARYDGDWLPGINLDDCVDMHPTYGPHRPTSMGSINPSFPGYAGNLLKQLDCYEYQSCEHRGWKTSEARVFCDALRTSVCGGPAPRHPVVRSVDGYMEAPWGID